MRMFSLRSNTAGITSERPRIADAQEDDFGNAWARLRSHGDDAATGDMHETLASLTLNLSRGSARRGRPDRSVGR